MDRNLFFSIFDYYGVKTVSKTDKSKDAYVLNRSQLEVLKKAGKKPSKERPAESFIINVLGDKAVKAVNATYYNSERKGSGRTVEPRLGTEIINEWLNVGDELALGTDGNQLFAIKLNDNTYNEVTPEAQQVRLISDLPDDLIAIRAKSAPRKAKKIKSTTETFIRNQYIIELAKRRANGKCEMPGCTYKPFLTEAGKLYLEGHHITPLAEGGDDAIDNVAALCPDCHRKLHYAQDKLDKRKILQKSVLNSVKRK